MDLIWLLRCQVVHGGKLRNPSSIDSQILKVATEHTSAAYLSSKEERWSPPPRGTIKANFDIAIRPNYAAAASIFGQRNGQIIHRASKIHKTRLVCCWTGACSKY